MTNSTHVEQSNQVFPSPVSVDTTESVRQAEKDRLRRKVLGKIDITRTTEIKNGDLQALLNSQVELHGLLSLICGDDFKGFRELSAKQQFGTLALARTLASEMGELFSTCLAAPAIRQTKQMHQKEGVSA